MTKTQNVTITVTLGDGQEWRLIREGKGLSVEPLPRTGKDWTALGRAIQAMEQAVSDYIEMKEREAER